jgi:hypothetical protein
VRWGGDSSSEMHRRQDIGDAAIEALLSGNGAGEGIPPSLAALADELRDLAVGPAPRPSPLLATLLQQGFSTENGDPSATAASNVPGPATEQAAGLPKWRRRRMVLAEFLAGLSVAAKATFGVGVAMASVTAAGAAGALPDAVQNVVATSVEAVTPFDLPDSGDADDDDEQEGVAGDESGDPAEDGSEDPENFGARVSADAQDGGVDGQEISEEAKLNGEANRAEAAGDAGRPEDPGAQGAGRANDAPTPAPTTRPDDTPATTTPDAGDDGDDSEDSDDTDDSPGDAADDAGDATGGRSGGRR